MLFFGIIRAIDPIDGDLKKWSIELDLPCSTIDEANEHCQNNELGYVLIEGKLDLETNLLLKGIQIIKIGLQLEVWKNDELKVEAKFYSKQHMDTFIKKLYENS